MDSIHAEEEGIGEKHTEDSVLKGEGLERQHFLTISHPGTDRHLHVTIIQAEACLNQERLLAGEAWQVLVWPCYSHKNTQEVYLVAIRCGFFFQVFMMANKRTLLGTEDLTPGFKEL